ncbi:DFG10 [Candida pseudojiufengensis]|uniref:DFG10 n=1 Tax=Candida pseudojiufengensis TaxID=497109 RepID=UPI0022249935|nr:DFG10 [Candida pseudojiufengensis]KAI5961033.1 DFG10 [Candida pseudojiufengensis]
MYVMFITTIHLQYLIIGLYLILTSGVLLVKVVKPLNKLLDYGKNTRLSSDSDSSVLVNFIANNAVVPKSWFTHFYICLFTLSTATYFQECHKSILGLNDSTTYKNFQIINKLLMIQGFRRMFESFFVTKFSPTSKMNISHYVVGMTHYVLIGLATYSGLEMNCGRSATFTVLDYVLMTIFGVASIQQFNAHYYLANLQKYSLPKFKYVSSPHYFYEIILYTVLMVFSIKSGFTNTSLMFIAAWIFVITNLTITAFETYNYYTLKYKEEFKLKYAIFPGFL